MPSRGAAIILVTALALLPAGWSGRAQGPQRLTVETLLDWHTATDPRLSPAGTHVVYVHGWADRMTDTNRSNLWLVSVDGKDHRALTQGSVRDSSPRWGPDGRRIAFVSDRSGKPQIHVLWMDTGQQAQITHMEEGPGNLAWSPDGTEIAFTKLVPAPGPSPIKLPPRPPGATWAEPSRVIDRLVYRQDGQGYLPYGYRHIFVVPATGGVPRQVTSGNYDHGAPEWTRDGRAILTSALRRPDPEYDTDGNDIFAVAVEDGASRQLTTRKGPDNNPTVSPDGRFIAYTGFDDKGLGYTVTRLYVMAIDGSNPKLLAGEWDRDVANPRWAADSTGIYFTSGDRGSTNLHFVSLGGAVRPVTEERQQLTGVDLGPGGRVVAVRSTPKEPGDIVTFTVQQPLRTTRLTGVNDSLLGTLQLGDVEEIWYKSFDGRDVQGWIVKPPGFDPSRKYPLILYIHGGPHMMYGVEFDHEFQTHAALDYVLLYTNPRGSTGYGQEFGNIIQYDYPGENLKDLMAGVDAVVARGYVDPKRMVITGGSGGGLMTAWTVTQTDRFAAAAAQYPSINWFTLVLTSDSAYQGLKRRFKKWMWEDPDEYLKRSPIRHAGNVRTPTLLITGEADWRTPISQSEEFYRALKLRKVDTLLVRVPDEPHGIGAGSSNHITHRMAKVLYLMEWFDKYTKPSGPVTSAKGAVER